MKLYVVDAAGVPLYDGGGRCACLAVPDINTRFLNWAALDGMQARDAAQVLDNGVRSVGYFGAGAGYMARAHALCARHPSGRIEIH